MYRISFLNLKYVTIIQIFNNFPQILHQNGTATLPPRVIIFMLEKIIERQMNEVNAEFLQITQINLTHKHG